LYIIAGEPYNSSDLTLGTYNKGNVIVDSEALVTNYSATVSGQLVVGTSTAPANIGNFYLTNSATFGKALAILNQTENQDILTASASGTTKFTLTNAGNIISAAGAKWMPTSNSTTALNIANASGTSFVTFDTTNSRVGIGTTSPVQKLHVEGQCVTGDTLLKRRRRRRKADGSLEEYWEDVRIDEIQEGDEILTLDEQTGQMVAAKVKKLMDKGIKPIFQLTTESGKTIRTTANHPYFVVEKFKKPKAGVFIDDSNLYHAYKKVGWRIDFAKLRKILETAFDVAFINYYLAVPDKNDKAFARTMKFIRNLPKDISLKTKPLKYLNHRQEKKGDVDVEISVDVFRTIKDLDVVIILTGDSDYKELAEFVLKDAKKKILFMGFNENMAWELRKLKHFYLDELKEAVAFQKTNTPKKVRGALLSLLYHNQLLLSSSWKKVSQIKEGVLVATEGKDGKVAWEEVISH